MCEEVGHPMEHNAFCEAYKDAFLGGIEIFGGAKREAV